MQELYHNHFILSNDEIEKRLNNEYSVIDRDNVNVHLKHLNCNTEFTTTLKLLLKAKIPCPKCSNRNYKMTDSEFKERIKSLVNDEYIPLIPYESSQKKVLMKHSVCNNTYLVMPNKFFTGRRCPYCAPNKKLSFDEVQNRVRTIDAEYDILNDNYKNIGELTRFIHKKCGSEFLMRPRDFFKQNGNRCPICNQSKGEKIIIDYLKSKNIKYETQYRIDNFNKLKRFDFCIFDNNDQIKFLLEYDGEFHYKPMNDSENSLKKFNWQRNSDKEKEEYCLQNHLKLVRIPFWYRDQLVPILDMIFNNDKFIVMSSNIPINSKINFCSTTIENS